jgi:hypothetical protein
MKTGFLDRVTLCSSCGAPIQASPNAEPARCTKCGAENRVVARVDDAVSEGWSKDELERLTHLRRQDQSYRPDPSIASLVVGMRLSRSHAAHAFATWQQLRAQRGSEATLTELTLLLAAQAADDSDPYRERGLLESALTTITSPILAHRLRAALALLAARMGDPAGAESWLATCDPRAVDLRSDSSHRLARAYIDTMRGDFGRVLVVLGGNDVEIPIAEELLGPCAVLRANAWERLGRPRTALELLLHYKFESNPFGQQLTRSFLNRVSRLDLCPTTEPEAERQRQLTLGRRRIPWTAGMVVVLCLFFYFALSGGLLMAYGMASAVSFGDEHAPTYGFFGFILLIPGAMMLLPFFPALKRTRNERAMLARGVLAPARCMPGAEASEAGHGVVYVVCRAWIAPDDAPPFEKAFTLKTSKERVDEFVRGTPFTVRYLGDDFLIEPSLR